MKNKCLIILIGSFFATALSVSAANALTMDTLLGQDLLGNSGDAAELAFIELLTGETLTLTSKVDSPVALADGPDQWYLDVTPDEPGFFLLKFGTGGTTPPANDTYVFENIAELSFLVWSNAQVNFLTGGGDCGTVNPDACNIGRLSHYTTTNGGDNGDPPDEIPEPSSILLIGSSLVGFGLWRLGRKQK